MALDFLDPHCAVAARPGQDDTDGAVPSVNRQGPEEGIHRMVGPDPLELTVSLTPPGKQP